MSNNEFFEAISLSLPYVEKFENIFRSKWKREDTSSPYIKRDQFNWRFSTEGHQQPLGNQEIDISTIGR